jgi:hypothetical protein
MNRLSLIGFALALIAVPCPAYAEAVPPGQSITMNCNQGTAPAASGGASELHAAVTPAESLFGPANTFTLGASFGVFSNGGQSRSVAGVQADLRLLHYLGIEGEAAVGLPGDGAGVGLGGMAFAKVLLPFRSPILDFTPKGGVGVVAGRGLAGMLGGEVEFFRFLAVTADLVAGLESRSAYYYPYGGYKKTGYQRVAVGAWVRLSPSFRAGARVIATESDGDSSRGYAVMIQYRF